MSTALSCEGTNKEFPISPDMDKAVILRHINWLLSSSCNARKDAELFVMTITCD